MNLSMSVANFIINLSMWRHALLFHTAVCIGLGMHMPKNWSNPFQNWPSSRELLRNLHSGVCLSKKKSIHLSSRIDQCNIACIFGGKWNSETWQRRKMLYEYKICHMLSNYMVIQWGKFFHDGYQKTIRHVIQFTLKFQRVEFEPPILYGYLSYHNNKKFEVIVVDMICL